MRLLSQVVIACPPVPGDVSRGSSRDASWRTTRRLCPWTRPGAMQGRPVRRGEFGKATLIHLRGPRRESESESRALESRPFLERVWTRSELFGRETPRAPPVGSRPARQSRRVNCSRHTLRRAASAGPHLTSRSVPALSRQKTFARVAPTDTWITSPPRTVQEDVAREQSRRPLCHAAQACTGTPSCRRRRHDRHHRSRPARHARHGHRRSPCCSDRSC